MGTGVGHLVVGRADASVAATTPADADVGAAPKQTTAKPPIDTMLSLFDIEVPSVALFCHRASLVLFVVYVCLYLFFVLFSRCAHPPLVMQYVLPAAVDLPSPPPLSTLRRRLRAKRSRGRRGTTTAAARTTR